MLCLQRREFITLLGGAAAANRETALATLTNVVLRHHAKGRPPTAERTVGPARNVVESLTFLRHIKVADGLPLSGEERSCRAALAL
jgi:hypothetical protein